MNTAYDAAVIGAGPAGATAARLLAGAGWKVALVERSAFPRGKVCGEFISAGTLAALHVTGAGEAIFPQAGPEIRRVGIYAGDAAITAPMPATSGPFRWGRALNRDRLDTVLRDAAVRSGAEPWQPWNVTGIEEDNSGVTCHLEPRGSGRSVALRAGILICAAGSWDAGPLPGQRNGTAAAADLFGFKVHFAGGTFPCDLMTLLAFPGGYGGLVTSNDGLVSLSCCIRRDQLARLRAVRQGLPAADAVYAAILENCRAVERDLKHAVPVERWLSVGPIQPGIRTLHRGRVFLAGNAAAESHPVIAEGITLAIQGAGLLAGILARRGPGAPDLEAAGKAYSRGWHAAFAARVRRSAWIAGLAMNPASTGMLLPVFRCFPGLLTACTRFSGKARASALPGIATAIPMPPGSLQ